MVAAGLLALYLILHGHSTFGLELFSTDTQAAIRKAVADDTRAVVAERVVENTRKELETTLDQATKVAKAFAAADESHAAGLAELEPFLAKMAQERAHAQQTAVDAVFVLRDQLTESEWNAVFAPPAEHTTR